MNRTTHLRRRDFIANATVSAVAMAAGTLVPAVVQAQQTTWPSRAIKIVAPAAPGGGADLAARILGRFFEQYFKQSFIVEAKPGAGTIVGTLAVKQAPPDGYTLLMTGNSTHSANLYLFKNLPYDPMRDFSDIGIVGLVPAVCLVNRSSKIRSVADLIAAAKASPGKLTYGYGTSSMQIPSALFKAQAGVDVVGVSYKASSQAIVDLVGGTIDFIFVDTLTATPALQNPNLVPIGTTLKERLPSMPNVPSVAETLPGYEFLAWTAISAPANVPQPIMDKLQAALHAAIGDKATTDALERMGMTISPMTTTQFAKFLDLDRKRWREWVRVANIEPQ